MENDSHNPPIMRCRDWAILAALLAPIVALIVGALLGYGPHILFIGIGLWWALR